MRCIFITVVFSLLAMSSAHCQDTLCGSVLDNDTKQGIPYATVHLLNSYVGTVCNTRGKFVLNIPKRRDNAQIVVSSLGYKSDTIALQTWRKGSNNIALEPYIEELVPVEVVEYTTAQKLMNDVIARIPQNYRTEDAVGIWFFRNRQTLDSKTYVISEGLMRNYMPPYGTMLTIRTHINPNKWTEDFYRLYQALDTVLIHDTAYWRSKIGSEKIEKMLELKGYSEPSNCWMTIGSDFVNYMEKKSLRMFSEKSHYTMKTTNQDGNNYYHVTIAYLPKGSEVYDTAKLVINKEDLAIIDVIMIVPTREYFPYSSPLLKLFYKSRYFTGKNHWHYHKYDGKYQLDFIQREYEDRCEFSQYAFEKGCKVPAITIGGTEECLLSEYSYEAKDYKRRYFDNRNPRNEENIKETERILRLPHNRIPW